MNKEEIALQLALETLKHMSFRNWDEAKTQSYELYNSIYNHLDCYKPSKESDYSDDSDDNKIVVF